MLLNESTKPHPDSEVEFWHVGNLTACGTLLLKERFDKTLIPLLSKERLGEVLPDQTKL